LLTEFSSVGAGSALDWPGDDGDTALSARGAAALDAKRSEPLGFGLVLFVGDGKAIDYVRREDALLFTFDARNDVTTLNVSATLDESSTQAALAILVVPSELCANTFGFNPTWGRWFLSPELRRILLALADNAGPVDGRSMFLRAKGLELACLTLELLADNALTPCLDTLGEFDTRRLFKARAFIEERFAEPLGLQRIAKAGGVNRSKLTRGFQMIFGVSVTAYVVDRRMRAARELLLTTDLPVQKIAGQVGYLNNASFSRAFVRHHGTAPNAMRKSRLRKVS